MSQKRLSLRDRHLILVARSVW